jgi:hypothetical protein
MGRDNAFSLGESECEPLKEVISKRLGQMSEELELSRHQCEVSFKDKVIASMSDYALSKPEAALEIEQICVGAGVPIWEYLLAANLTDYRDHGGLEGEGCTAMLSRSENGHCWFAQTWDLGEYNMEHMIVVDKTTRGQRVVSLSCTAFPPLMGMNQQGLVWGTTNIKTKDVGPGLGYQLCLDGLSRQVGLGDAVDWLRSQKRAGSHAYILAQEDEGHVIEAGQRHFVSRTLNDDALCQSNHPQSKVLAELALEVPSSSSQSRLKRMISHCRQQVHLDVEVIKGILSDRSCGVDSISRLPEDGTGITTNACMIANVRERELFLCGGDARDGTWETFKL